VPFARTRVGEAHVVTGMKAAGAVIGGEGNGGVIAPEAHLGRDGTVAAALACQAWADAGGDLGEAVRRLPAYVMMKDKVEGVTDWPSSEAVLLRSFPGFTVDRTDGLRFADASAWVHVRPSGTEPIVRIIAEAKDRASTDALLARARGAFAV
jgi:phosphomannomutase